MKPSILFLICLFITACSDSDTSSDTPAAGTSADTVRSAQGKFSSTNLNEGDKLTLYYSISEDATVNWGDGTTTRISPKGSSTRHRYLFPGTYKVSIQPDGGTKELVGNVSVSSAKIASNNSTTITPYLNNLTGKIFIAKCEESGVISLQGGFTVPGHYNVTDIAGTRLTDPYESWKLFMISMNELNIAYNSMVTLDGIITFNYLTQCKNGSFDSDYPYGLNLRSDYFETVFENNRSEVYIVPINR